MGPFMWPGYIGRKIPDHNINSTMTKIVIFALPLKILDWHLHSVTICLFVFEFFGPVNNEVMSSRSVTSGTVPRQAYTFLAINQY